MCKQKEIPSNRNERTLIKKIARSTLNCQNRNVLAHEYRNMGSKLARTKEKHSFKCV